MRRRLRLAVKLLGQQTTWEPQISRWHLQPGVPTPDAVNENGRDQFDLTTAMRASELS
jgi:hypothetical protein